MEDWFYDETYEYYRQSCDAASTVRLDGSLTQLLYVNHRRETALKAAGINTSFGLVGKFLVILGEQGYDFYESTDQLAAFLVTDAHFACQYKKLACYIAVFAKRCIPQCCSVQCKNGCTMVAGQALMGAVGADSIHARCDELCEWWKSPPFWKRWSSARKCNAQHVHEIVGAVLTSNNSQ